MLNFELTITRDEDDMYGIDYNIDQCLAFWNLPNTPDTQKILKGALQEAFELFFDSLPSLILRYGKLVD